MHTTADLTLHISSDFEVTDLGPDPDRGLMADRIWRISYDGFRVLDISGTASELVELGNALAQAGRAEHDVLKDNARRSVEAIFAERDERDAAILRAEALVQGVLR